jgi:hypothetical protein
MEENKRENERNEGRKKYIFQVRVYNCRFAGLNNKKFEGIEH